MAIKHGKNDIMLKHNFWVVYILQCFDNTLYTGITNDLQKRLIIHNRGKASKYTRTRLPVKLIYSESVDSKSSALKREYFIKQLSRKDKIKLMLNSYRYDPTGTKKVDQRMCQRII